MPDRKGFHLDLDDRLAIQEGLFEGRSFRSIASSIGVAATTVSREVKANRISRRRTQVPNHLSSTCVNQRDCTVRGLCDLCTSKAPSCHKCRRKRCIDLCPRYERRTCRRTARSPFVCTGCKRRYNCSFTQYFYHAHTADEMAAKRLREARLGIGCSQEELSSMVSKVKVLLSKGQSLEAIWATHADEFPVGVRTFYNYVERGFMGLSNMDLPKKVRYKPRRKDASRQRIDFTGRTYDDFMALDEQLRLSAVQLDCVEGRIFDSQCILSLHFPRFAFQIYLLLSKKTQSEVVGALDAIESYCEGGFSDHFGVILTDRGSEFLDFPSIERSVFGGTRCKVYYCDPLKSNQKARCEKNHVELRKILVKQATDFDALTPWDVSLVCSHVNSYPRPSLGGVSPYRIASQILPESLLGSLGIDRVEPDDVVMSPSLLIR